MARSFGSSGEGDFGSGANCDQPIDVSLTTAPELKPQLEAAAKSLAGRDDSQQPCATFKISQAAPSVVAEQLASGNSNRPDLWIPDSSLWVARADDGQSTPTVAVPSVASTPLVLVGQSSAFATTASWLAAFQNTTPYLLDPQHTTTGLAALIAVQAERVKTKVNEAQVSNMLVPLAQKHGSLAKPYTDLEGLFSKAAQDNNPVVVPAPEQAFVKYQDEHPEIVLTAKVPATGTIVLDYPIVMTARDNTDKINEAAQLLAREMASDEVSQARDQAGFRNPAMDALGGRGVGPVDVLSTPQTEVATAALNQWERFALSTHSLVVIDISGSMNEKVGNQTRMQLAIAAAEKGLELFPEHAQLGLWAFSTEIPNARTTDWVPLVPIRALGQKVNGAKQRQHMLNALRSLGGRVGGGTGLYETAVGAYRTVQDGFDQSSINSVIIFTDGKNDDADSNTLAETLNTLENLRDPARPVRIIAIGMGPDADANELEKLAKATNGRSYIARNPEAIREVFIDAVKAR